MRGVAILALLAGCPAQGTPQCTVDTDCGGNGEVCARDGECLPADEVQMVKVSWTIGGAAADATTCAPFPSFYLEFDGSMFEDTFGYEPVPCVQGQFTIDKLPTRFVQVDIGVQGQWTDTTQIESGAASFDIAP